MLPGVRPSISLASLPTASTRPLTLLMATIDGSLTTMPLPRAYTQVLAVPRSIARSLEKSEKREPKGNQSAPRHMDPVFPFVLHLVHGRVRDTQQVFGGLGDVWEGGDAYRGGKSDGQTIRTQEDVGPDAVPDALGHSPGALGIGIRQNQCELVAAEPSDDVGFTGTAADDGARLDERLAARQMTVAVVHLLETVQVEKEHRQRTAAAHRALGFAAQHFIQMPRVGQQRQIIRHGQRVGLFD